MPSVKKIWTDHIPWLLPAALAAALLPLLLLGRYAHPAADDYSFGVFPYWAIQAGEPVLAGVWDTVSSYYGGWQGTYSSVAVMSLVPSIWGTEYYALTPVFMLASLTLGTLKLTHTLVCRMAGGSVKGALCAGCAMVLLAVELVPFPLHSFYWWNGACYYTFTYGLMLLLVDRLLVLRLADRPRQLVWPLLSGLLLAVYVGGSNYVSLLLMLILGAVFCLYCLLWRRKKLPFAALIELVLFAGFLVSALAPGNRVRQSGLTGQPPVTAILNAISRAWEDLAAWLSPTLLLALLLAAPFLYGLAGRTRFRFRCPPAFFLFAFLIFASQNTPHFYAAGTAGPERLRNIVFFAYLWLLVLCEFYGLGWLRKRFAPHKAAPLPALRAVAGVAAALLLVGSLRSDVPDLTTKTAVDELLDGSAAAYSAEMEARMALYEDPEVLDVAVPAIVSRPSLLYWTDMSSTPEWWTNGAVQRYFGKHSVVVIP